MCIRDSLTLIRNYSRPTYAQMASTSYEPSPVTTINIEERKKQVGELLSKFLLPWKEIEESHIEVMEVVTIEPPYTYETCKSFNQIVLAKVQKLLQQHFP
eukprot:TRINITY_DN20520_c0_g1_i1.p1 TRINITY_DN20520_c0_g1~~TRINITY_DN20520_c0_g1_i1.p1  ORF type:complete len:100 (+),score=12.00 TRINITY_DN20520_c0_g1_i1:27-326(+)